MPTQKEPTKKPVGELPNGLPIRVVVVDDEFAHRRILVQTLKSAGFDVVAEGVNGEDAIKFVDEHRPRLLFLDYHMPRMDGLTALAKVHAAHPETKVVMVTTDHDKDKVLEALKEGAVEYIVKPVERKIVLDKLEKLVRHLA